MSKKVILAYSGGLDTSAIVKWLQVNYGYEVITFTADLGQEKKDIESAYKKAKLLGIKKIYIEDLREIFVKHYIFPMFRANTIYEGGYLLGTSIARPLIIKRLLEIAKLNNSNIISHGSTGKGNDQLRFELGAYSLNPYIKIIAPWREWNLTSRKKIINYCKQNNISIDFFKKNKSPYSMDNNLLHISYEGGLLEDTWNEPEHNMWRWSNSLNNTPDKETYIDITFQQGDPIAINNEYLKPHELLIKLNNLGSKHGVGRIDIVENRYIGIKSRGCYETPGGTILYHAHKAIESITLDHESIQLKDILIPIYAEMIYNGYWWTTERKMLQSLIDTSQKYVNGVVRIKLYKGNVIIIGRKSDQSLFNSSYATFEEDKGIYNQKDAESFIKLKSIRLKLASIQQHTKCL
ncbi:argininosuccinate synthase [Candidatus Portiera aleyrodidarum]|uniref:Argininosuccinate synthase n=1 Tax=Candidatus Portiera aleyrodidarum TaxID=91844 RepID=A0A6S6S673_9GAMM|nr:argininosuccinate synthase [Candidatus Portiera aleyrodidarum]CAA3708077.1 Argininosuccinate synthase [Candidatus Portiera aleyrodidarum]